MLKDASDLVVADSSCKASSSSAYQMELKHIWMPSLPVALHTASKVCLHNHHKPALRLLMRICWSSSFSSCMASLRHCASLSPLSTLPVNQPVILESFVRPRERKEGQDCPSELLWRQRSLVRLLDLLMHGSRPAQYTHGGLTV